MNIKGLKGAKKLVEGMINIIASKIVAIDWDKSGADEKDDRLNDISDHLETIAQEIEEIEEL